MSDFFRENIYIVMNENNKLVIIKNKLLPQSQSSISKRRFIVKFWVLREHQDALLSMCCGKHLGADKIWVHRRKTPATQCTVFPIFPHSHLPTALIVPMHPGEFTVFYFLLPLHSPASEFGGQFGAVIVKA